MNFLTAQEARKLQQLVINSDEYIFLETHKDFLNELAEKVKLAAMQGHNWCNINALYKITENEFYTLIKVMENLGYKIKIDNGCAGTTIYLYW